MIVVSAGMQRSGSRWYYDLTRDLMLAAGCADALAIREKYDLQDFLNLPRCNMGRLENSKLRRLDEIGREGNTFLVKTHHRPSPGLRTVRIHPLAALDQVVSPLTAWRGRLQGAALAGDGAWAIESALSELGISRCAAPGSLQSADALWHNGGLHPLQALGS